MIGWRFRAVEDWSDSKADVIAAASAVEMIAAPMSHCWLLLMPLLLLLLHGTGVFMMRPYRDRSFKWKSFLRAFSSLCNYSVFSRARSILHNKIGVGDKRSSCEDLRILPILCTWHNKFVADISAKIFCSTLHRVKMSLFIHTSRIRSCSSKNTQNI